MGLIDDFKALRDDLFTDFGDVVDTVIIRNPPTSNYNETTRVNSLSYGSIVSVRGAFRYFSQKEIGGEIQNGDGEITIDHDAVGSIVSPTAKITIGSTSYIIKNVDPVPKANPVVQKLHVRETRG